MLNFIKCRHSRSPGTAICTCSYTPPPYHPHHLQLKPDLPSLKPVHKLFTWTNQLDTEPPWWQWHLFNILWISLPQGDLPTVHFRYTHRNSVLSGSSIPVSDHQRLLGAPCGGSSSLSSALWCQNPFLDSDICTRPRGKAEYIHTARVQESDSQYKQ